MASTASFSGSTVKNARLFFLVSGFIFAVCYIFQISLVRAEEPSNAVPARRVVSLSPHFTEIAYDIGAGDRLIAVTDFCRFPVEAQKLPKVGGFLDLNVETVVRMNPDLVLGLPFFGPKLDAIRRRKVPVLTMEDSRVSDVLAAYDALGKVFGLEKKAAAAKARLMKKLSALKAPEGPRPTAMFVVGTETGSLAQMTVAGRGAFTHELLEQSGFRNIFMDVKTPYIPVSREEVLSRNPDVIFHVLPGNANSPENQERLRTLYQRWKSLRAARDGHIYFITKDEWTIPGPTMVGLGEYFMEVRRMLQVR
jgi:iron complex transport system substrate-binding protein